MANILKKECIIIGSTLTQKDDVIKEIGRLMSENGYATPAYTTAMLEKEKVFNTAIGYGLAIPHGIETMKSEIQNSGIVIMTFPNGIQWGNDQVVKLVIGIAGKGEEHMDILSNIALTCSSDEAVDVLSQADADALYGLFSGN